MKVKLTLIEEMLGTACQNKEVHAEFIASKSADSEKMKEELESLPSDELLNKAITVFPRGPDGKPILFDYQVKGFIKETFSIMFALRDGVKIGKAQLSKWTAAKIVDNHIDITPRMIPLSRDVGEICTRPLRAQTMKGERVSLASSESVPAGATMEFEITTEHPALDELVIEALNRGSRKGLGQWRNSGKGRFSWEEVK